MFDQVPGSLFPANEAGVGLNSIIQLLINKLTLFIKLLTDKILRQFTLNYVQGISPKGDDRSIKFYRYTNIRVPNGSISNVQL